MALRSIAPDAKGRHNMAVNLRMADPERIADIAVRYFDGFDTFEDAPADGRHVKDFWF